MNYHITYEKPFSDIMHEMTIRAEDEDKAKTRFYLLHPTFRILNVNNTPVDVIKNHTFNYEEINRNSK